MPSLSITRRERRFAGTVKETTSASPSGPKAWARTAVAASVA